jgi:hypothetical protein
MGGELEATGNVSPSMQAASMARLRVVVGRAFDSASMQAASTARRRVVIGRSIRLIFNAGCIDRQSAAVDIDEGLHR